MEEHHANLLQALQQSTAALQAAVAAIAPHHTTARAEGHSFCVAEHVCHLRDLESEGFGLRLRRVLTEELPLLDELDGTRMAAERSYASQQVQPAWRDFARLRELNIDLLRRRLPADADRAGRFGSHGTVTLESLGHAMLEHDDEHLQRLTELRAVLG